MQAVSQHSARNPFLALLGWAIAASLVCGLPLAVAQDSFRVGVVNPQTILKESAYGKRKRADLEEHRSARRKVLDSDEEDLNKLQDKLQASQDASDADRQSMQQQLQRKFQKYQERVQTFEQELSKKQDDMETEYLEKLQVVAKTVAEQKGFAMVTNMNVVLYSSQGLDVTEDVLKEFEKLYP